MISNSRFVLSELDLIHIHIGNLLLKQSPAKSDSCYCAGDLQLIKTLVQLCVQAIKT